LHSDEDRVPDLYRDDCGPDDGEVEVSEEGEGFFAFFFFFLEGKFFF